MSISVVRARLDEGPTGSLMWVVVFLCFLLNLADGVDVVAMSVTAPSVANEWLLDRSELGPLFSAALVGMAVGGAGLAPLSDKFGRRLLLIFAMFLVGLSMVAVPFIATTESIVIFAALRFLSGLGIGVIFGSTPALASEFMPTRLKSMAVSIVIMGYPIGAIFAGPIANTLMPVYGWPTVFLAGGILTLVLAVLIWLFLPESPEFLATQPGDIPNREAAINRLLTRLNRQPIENVDSYVQPPAAIPLALILTPERRMKTLALWLVYFLGFLAMYFMLSWIPTLFVGAGYTQAQGVDALTLFNLGAIPGILALAYFSTRLPLALLLSFAFGLAGVVLAYLGLAEPSELQILTALIFIAGVLMHSGFTCLYALVAEVYPSEVRAAGIGWSAGVGRSGAIASPIVAAALLSLGWSMYSLFLVFAVPLVTASVLLWFFKRDG
jgi:AAHS family 4-hydroxybenzoate transporter-like MFS transporter